MEEQGEKQEGREEKEEREEEQREGRGGERREKNKEEKPDSYLRSLLLIWFLIEHEGIFFYNTSEFITIKIINI